MQRHRDDANLSLQWTIVFNRGNRGNRGNRYLLITVQSPGGARPRRLRSRDPALRRSCVSSITRSGSQFHSIASMSESHSVIVSTISHICAPSDRSWLILVCALPSGVSRASIFTALQEHMTSTSAMTSGYTDSLADAAEYVSLLVGLLVVFGIVNAVVRYSGVTRSFADRTMRLLSAGYGFVYAILAGILIYFGIENLNGFVAQFTPHQGLITLISVSVVAMFCLLYAAVFHSTVSLIAGQRLKINPFSNVASYVFARVLLIGALVVASALSVRGMV